MHRTYLFLNLGLGSICPCGSTWMRIISNHGVRWLMDPQAWRTVNTLVNGLLQAPHVDRAAVALGSN